MFILPSIISDLFITASLPCWLELSEDQHHELIRSIELALNSQDIVEFTQTLLNLAMFMEHSDKVGSYSEQRSSAPVPERTTWCAGFRSSPAVTDWIQIIHSSLSSVWVFIS